MTARGRRLAILLASTFAVWLVLGTLRLDYLIPHDEGLLGQSAERVQGGELPHVDFDDTYTGGQAMLHAAIFELFGARSANLRHALWLAALPFLWALFALFGRSERPWPAAGLTLLALVWSLPCYFAAMPSWYILFLVIFGLWALERAIFDRCACPPRKRWLFLAGAAAGMAVLFKVVGLYFLGAVFLTIWYYLQRRHRAAPGAPSFPSGPFALAGATSGLAAALAVTWVLRQDLGATSLLYFVAPTIALAWVLVAEERRPRGLPWPTRASELGAALTPLALGAALPIALFLVPFARVEGGLAALARGVFVLPQLRLGLAELPMPPFSLVLLGLPLLTPLFLPGLLRPGWAKTGAVALLAFSFFLAGNPDSLGYGAIWAALPALGPLLAIDLCRRLIQESGGAPRQEVRAYALAATAVLMGLTRYPYASEVYFAYVAPLVLLLVVAWARLIADPAPGDAPDPATRPRRFAWLAVGLACYAFAAFWLHRGNAFSFGLALRPRAELAMFLPERVGLRIPKGMSERYPGLIRFIQDKVPPGQPILALPDTPETYFFSERRNPTRLLFDALSAERLDDGELARLLGEVGLVVINHQPGFSPPLDPAQEAMIARAFPRQATLGALEIRYR